MAGAFTRATLPALLYCVTNSLDIIYRSSSYLGKGHRVTFTTLLGGHF
jgi:hypothetical protein